MEQDGIGAGDLPDTARTFIAALLQLPSATAERIRAQTPNRRRPLAQSGPSADYGAPPRPRD